MPNVQDCKHPVIGGLHQTDYIGGNYPLEEASVEGTVTRMRERAVGRVPDGTP